ncbi:MAG TPA: acyltransferase domain-containing protein [Acetivibrio clariflavus]|nr:acyltransferase domain-containing protein [Acetivibrio clariflavus]
MQKDINQTEVAQVLLFIIEYSLALLLKNWGIIPDSMIGHSLGEYVAACVSGVLSLEDALKLVCCRAKFMQQMERGSMVSVSLGKSEVEELLDGCSDVCIAATNSQKHTVISGTFKSVEKIIKIMEQRGISYIKLHVSHAFHSFMMEPMLREYEKILKTVNFNTPTIPYISNLTGNFITVEQAKDPNYYLEHIRKTVCFKEGIDTLSVYKDTIYLEIGPGGLFEDLFWRTTVLVILDVLYR